MIEPRLLSPEQVATYLGLGSRWAVYRLVDGGELPRLKLAGKLRFDREDLDRLIDEKKRRRAKEALAALRRVHDRARTALAPLPPRRISDGDSSVTGVAKLAVTTARNRRTSDISSVARRLGEGR